jgi:small subunit ribosomal protein S2
MNISLRDLLESGVHFGHQTRRWNPKMKPYIYGAKNGIHIIDLQQTARGLVGASRFITQTIAHGGSLLFVGTKRAARDIVREEACRASMFYVNNRWLGGTMTNWQTVRKSIDRLRELEKAREEGKFDLLSKKEALLRTREIEKMEKNLGGIKMMKKLPSVLFVVDPRKEHLAVKEANTLKIPVVALCDTNCDPSGVDYVIPGNDDAIKAIRLFVAGIADAAIEGRDLSTSRQDNAPVVAKSGGAEVEVIKRPTVEAPAAEAPAEEAAASEAPAAEETPAVEEAPAEETKAEAAPEAATDSE